LVYLAWSLKLEPFTRNEERILVRRLTPASHQVRKVGLHSCVFVGLHHDGERQYSVAWKHRLYVRRRELAVREHFPTLRSSDPELSILLRAKDLRLL
jgi:hypothetical protein